MKIAPREVTKKWGPEMDEITDLLLGPLEKMKKGLSLSGWSRWIPRLKWWQASNTPPNSQKMDSEMKRAMELNKDDEMPPLISPEKKLRDWNFLFPLFPQMRNHLLELTGHVKKPLIKIKRGLSISPWTRWRPGINWAIGGTPPELLPEEIKAVIVNRGIKKLSLIHI